MGFLAKKRNRSRGARRGWWRLAQTVVAGAVVAMAAPRHDVFIFASPQSALVWFGYPFLRLLGKVIITVFHGTDARPPYMNAKYAGTAGAIDTADLQARTKRMTSLIRRIERLSDAIVNIPGTAQFASRPFVSHLTMGFPVAVGGHGSANVHEATEGAVRILHAPSNTNVKGTAEIREAIARLQAEGIRIDYVEVTGRPHREVISELAQADIVVDQAYSDQPMPGLATEAAGFGKPVVIGSEDWEGALSGISSSDIPPTFRARSSEMVDAIRHLVADRSLRRKH
jgi:hypothetical protein